MTRRDLLKLLGLVALVPVGLVARKQYHARMDRRLTEIAFSYQRPQYIAELVFPMLPKES